MNNYRNNRKNRFKSSNDRGFRKRNSGRNNQNAAKLIEKYNNLAREASSSGDKILSENYLQHADHFSRILSLQETSKMSNDNNNVIEQNFKKSVEEINSEKQEVENVKDIIKND